MARHSARFMCRYAMTCSRSRTNRFMWSCCPRSRRGSARLRAPKPLFVTTIDLFPDLAADRHRRDLLAQHADFLAVHAEQHAHAELQHAGDGQAHVVQRILPEYIQLQRERLDVAEAAELQQLAEAVFRDDVKMVDVVSKVFSADKRIGAVHGIHDDAPARPQRCMTQT